MKQKKEKEKKGLWILKFFLLLGVVLSAYIAYAVSKVVYRKNQVQKEISKLQEEAAKIEKENGQLKDKLAYFESRDFQEKEVKDKLNLQDPDENMVVIKPGIAKEAKEAPKSDPERKKEFENTPIYEKWWDYFFKY